MRCVFELTNQIAHFANTSSAYNTIMNLSARVGCTIIHGCTASGTMAVCREWSDAEPALLSRCVDDGIFVFFHLDIPQSN